MKKARKVLSLILALVMVLALAVTANAQNVTVDPEGPATITIENASKGVTYYVYKVFGATVNEEKSIAYTYEGDLPSTLSGVFQKVGTTKYVERKPDVKDDAIIAAVEEYVKTATPINNTTTAEGTTPGTVNTDGGKMVFTVDYGYYVIKSNLSTDVKLTVDSTTPNASVYDKATATVPHFPTTDGKKSDKETYKIGETVTYTVTFNTANWVGEGEKAKQVKEYTFTDTLPKFLSDVDVTSVTIKQTGKTDETLDKDFDDNGTMTIDWLLPNGDSAYDNGAQIVIVYTATVNDKVVIGPEAENKNVITASWTYTDNSTVPEDDKPKAEETIYSYSFEMVKVNNNDEALAGASFSLYDVETGGNPISLVEVGTGTNIYRLAITTGTESVDAEDTRKTVVTTPADGKITIQGLANGTYWMEETEAPNGYNKLTERKSVTIENANKTSSTADGFRIVNQTGLELPDTGGIGTTIFTVVGGVLMVGAAILFITKKRSEDING